MTDAAADRPNRAVSLRPVTVDTLNAICRLQVTESQRRMVVPNDVSIAEAYFHREEAWFRGIYAGDEPVGFVMLYDSPAEGVYFLWRLMIDERFQGRGYGRRALELLVDYVRARPNAKELGVSYHKGAGSPEGFYRKLGFVETGEMEGDEHVARLALGPAAAGEKEAAPAEPRTPVDAYALGAGLIRYCIGRGWVTQEGSGPSAPLFVTAVGRSALKEFGIDL
jgi:diamine N-acetyltransferase